MNRRRRRPGQIGVRRGSTWTLRRHMHVPLCMTSGHLVNGMATSLLQAGISRKRVKATHRHCSDCPLHIAGLPTLSWRRREHCLVLLWKLVNGIGPPALLNVLPATAASRSSSVLRSSHSLQFPLCLSSRRKSSFLCYTIPIWNKLSSSVISCSSVSSFQCSLRKAFAADKFAYGLT